MYRKVLRYENFTNSAENRHEFNTNVANIRALTSIKTFTYNKHKNLPETQYVSTNSWSNAPNKVIVSWSLDASNYPTSDVYAIIEYIKN